MARAHEQLVPFRPAEADVRTHLRQADAADQLALRIVDQHTGIAERRVGAAPQVAGHVGTHAVRSAMHAVHRHVEEFTPVQHLAALHVERVDGARAAGVTVAGTLAGADHVQGLVVGGKADAVRVLELVLGHHLIEPAARIPAIHRVRQLPLRAPIAPAFSAPIPGLSRPCGLVSPPASSGCPSDRAVAIGRVGEPDAAVGMRYQIVRRIQRLAIEGVGDHRHGAVVFPADHPAEEILGGKLSALKVERVAVAVVRRFAELGHAAIVPQEPILRVALHIAEHEVLTLARPCRPFRPQEAGGDPVDRGDAEQVVLERRIDDDDVRIGIDVRRCVASPLSRRIADDGGRRPGRGIRLLCDGTRGERSGADAARNAADHGAPGRASLTVHVASSRWTQPKSTPRLRLIETQCRYFQLARKNRGSSSGYGLKLSCFA